MDFTVLEARTFHSNATKAVSRFIKDYELDMELSSGRIYSFGSVQKKKLYKGDILFRTPHGIVNSEGTQSTCILTLDFSGGAIAENYSRNICGDFQKPCHDPLIERFEPLLHPQNPTTFDGIYDKLINLSDKNCPAAKELVHELLYMVNAEICKRNFELLRPSDDVCKAALSYMRKNAQNNITLEELAKLVHLEKSYFARIFKKSTGKSPIEMLISIRLDKASDLIANTDIKICDIAVMCGYNTVSFFISAYKKRYGITPEEHRKILTDSAKQ